MYGTTIGKSKHSAMSRPTDRLFCRTSVQTFVSIVCGNRENMKIYLKNIIVLCRFWSTFAEGLE
jgi:hypothetical protein